MKHGFTYILSSQRNGTLYIGVTNGLYKRMMEHRSGQGSAFTKRYGVHLLVWYAFFEDIRIAIQKETSLKRWPRRWKLDPHEW